MNNTNLRQIQYFKITIKCSSFSRAAKLAYTARSTISESIATLEKIMGEPLFTRQKKGITPAQRVILLDSKLAEIYDKVDSLLNSTYQSKWERVSIGSYQDIDFSSFIPEPFSLFRRQSYIPTAVIKLQCCESSDVANGVLDGPIDLGSILPDTDISNPNTKLHTIALIEPQILSSVNNLLNKSDLAINGSANYPIVTTKYLIEKDDYRMINLLPFTSKDIEIVRSYDDIPTHLATGPHITLLRPHASLMNNEDVMNYRLPNSYHYKQGITMIWFSCSENKYLRQILSVFYEADMQYEPH